MLPVHGLKRASKKMRWLVSFLGVLGLANTLYSARQQCPALSFFRRRDNGKRYVVRPEERLDDVATDQRGVRNLKYLRTRHRPSQGSGEAGRRVSTEETLFATRARGSESQRTCDFVFAKMAGF